MSLGIPNTAGIRRREPLARGWSGNVTLLPQRPSDSFSNTAGSKSPLPGSDPANLPRDASPPPIQSILGALVAITIALAVFNLLSPYAGEGGIAGVSWTAVEIGMLILLLGVQAILILAFSSQDRNRRWEEAHLRDRESEIELTADAVQVGLWRWDVLRHRYKATKLCRELLGMTGDQPFSGDAMLQVIQEDDRAPVAQALDRAATSSATQEIECQLGPDGPSARWVRLRACPLRADDGLISHVAGTVVDITEKRRARSEADRQLQSIAHMTRAGMVGQLSGALAHELNQPLTAIMSNAQALQRLVEHVPVDMDEVRAAIADIAADNSRAVDIIRHLRTLLKKDDAHHEVIDLKALVLATLRLIHSDLVGRHIEVVTRLPDGPLLLSGDGIQLQHLLLNLISNASDAMADVPQGRMLLVVAEGDTDEAIHLSVSDSGPGIPNETLGKLFQPFVSTKQHGLGLGLSIARAIVDAHEGRIAAENNPSRGATFHVYFPLARRMTR